LLTILFGQSGLGKTSSCAGIVPRLRPEGSARLRAARLRARTRRPPAQQNQGCDSPRDARGGHWTQTGIAKADESLWKFLHHRDDLLRESAPAGN